MRQAKLWVGIAVVLGCGAGQGCLDRAASKMSDGDKETSQASSHAESLGGEADKKAAATAQASSDAPAVVEGAVGIGPSAQGYGAGRGLRGPARHAASPPPMGVRRGRETEESAMDAPPLFEAPLDPNGRFATTYRPGAGHLTAFDSAVAVGLVPIAEREVVSDIGARYVASVPAPKTGALAFQTDLERSKAAPSGGPVHLRFTVKSSDSKPGARPPVAVVVVLDVSGSMRGELIKSARSAAESLVDKLEPSDDFALVTFSTEAQVVIPMAKVKNRKETLKQTIESIHETGGTNIGGGLTLGYQQLAKSSVPKDAVRVAMLLSDGRANEGITASSKLSKLALDAFQEGIQTSAFGLGSDYDGPLMSQLANDGAGGYYYLRSGEQIASALSTELDKRLDPVATALEVRVRLKPGVELLDVYGSRRLNSEEAQRVRTIEIAQDEQTAKRDKIKVNRKDDNVGGMRFFIPAFARDDSHTLLLKLKVPESVSAKDLATIEVKYKDRLVKKNVAEEFPVKIQYAVSDAESARSADPSVQRTVQGFLAGQTLMKASRLVAFGQKKEAADLLAEREVLLAQAVGLLSEPLFLKDAQRLARLRGHIDEKGQLADPLVLAMMMETAGNVHLH